MTVQYQIGGSSAAEISASVEAGVRGGRLPAGAALPPVRTLAGRLGVSPGTVAAAYQVLRQRGVVETAGRLGTRVRPRPPVAPTRMSRAAFVPPDVLDLSTGEPDARLLPALGGPLRRVAAQLTTPVGYEAAGSLPALVELARQRLAADGVPVDGAEVTVTGGALDGIERLLTAHLRPGDRVAVEDPGWANLLDLVAALGMTAVPTPVDDDGPTEAGLRAALAAGVGAVIVTSRAQNPTGAALTRARAVALRRVLRSAGEVLVVEDDHAAELANVALHPLAGATPHWAFLRSASKPYGPDLRLSLLAGDEATVARVAGRLRLGAGWASTVLQRVLVELWRDERVAAAVADAAASYARRRSALCAALQARGVPARGRSGLNVWIPLPPGATDETSVVLRLRDAGYAVAPGALYRMQAGPAIRITVSRLAESDVDPLAGVVADALADIPTNRARSR